MIGSDEFTMYCNGVPAIGAYCGSPSISGVKLGLPVIGTLTVWGIELAMSASCACAVPATDGNTAAAGDSTGTFLKSAGNALLATNDHLPISDGALNQPP